MGYETVSLIELLMGFNIDTKEHPSAIYENSDGVVAVIDSDSGELLVIEVLH